MSTVSREEPFGQVWQASYRKKNVAVTVLKRSYHAYLDFLREERNMEYVNFLFC